MMFGVCWRVEGEGRGGGDECCVWWTSRAAVVCDGVALFKVSLPAGLEYWHRGGSRYAGREKDTRLILY